MFSELVRVYTKEGRAVGCSLNRSGLQLASTLLNATFRALAGGALSGYIGMREAMES